jgi:N-methylhydantoinase A
MFAIVNNSMVNGIRRVSVERGYDPRDFVLVGAGGATAAHITALAREMGIDTIILPKLASGLCAFGQIISDVKYNYMAPAPVRLDNAAVYERIDSLFRDIEAKGIAHLEADGFSSEAIDIKRSIDMRYVGQVHECTVDIGTFAIDDSTIEQVKDAFHARHEELYTYAERHSAVEVVNLESTIYGRIEKVRPPKLAENSDMEAALKGYRDAIFDKSGNATSTPIYDGAKFEAVTTTIVIEPGWTSVLHESGSYLLTREN